MEITETNIPSTQFPRDTNHPLIPTSNQQFQESIPKRSTYVLRVINSHKSLGATQTAKSGSESSHIQQISGLNSGLVQLKERLKRISSSKNQFNPNDLTLEGDTDKRLVGQAFYPASKDYLEMDGPKYKSFPKTTSNKNSKEISFLLPAEQNETSDTIMLEEKMLLLLRQNDTLKKQKNVLIERLTREIKQKEDISQTLARIVKARQNSQNNHSNYQTSQLTEANQIIKRLEAEIEKIKDQYVQTSLDCFNEALRNQFETIARLRSELENERELILDLRGVVKEQCMKVTNLQRQLKTQEATSLIQLNSLKKRYDIMLSDKQNEISNLRNVCSIIHTKYDRCLKQLSYRDEFIFNYFVSRSKDDEKMDLAEQLKCFKIAFKDNRTFDDHLKDQRQISELAQEIAELKAKLA